jgi:predicted PurR-regulated permease PerM
MVRKSQAILKIISITAVIMVLLKLCLVFLWPFAASVLIVFLLEPFVKIFIRMGTSRKIGVLLSLVITGTILIFMSFYVSSYIYNQIIVIFHKLPEIMKIFSDKFKFIDFGDKNYNDAIKGIELILSSYKGRIFYTLLSTVNGIVFLVIIIMSTIFISIDLDNIVLALKKYLPAEFYIVFKNVFHKITQVVKVQFRLILASTLQTVVGLYVLGVDKPLTIGVICGILDILPVAGPAFVFIPWIIYEFIISKVFVAVGLILLFLMLLVSREILEVKFMQSNLRIRPIIIIFSLYIGVVFYGVWGMICGPFVIILVKELTDKIYERRTIT